MCDDGMGVWHAFYVTMFALGLVSTLFTLAVFGWAAWQDLKRLWNRPVEILPLQHSGMRVIGFRPNRRVNPNGFKGTN